MDELAPLIVSVTFILVTGGVILFRPLMGRLGDFLEVLTRERLQAAEKTAPSAQVGDTLAALDARLERLEERQSFTEQLLLRGQVASRGLKAGTREADAAPGGETPVARP